jgi:endoglucanase
MLTYSIDEESQKGEFYYSLKSCKHKPLVKYYDTVRLIKKINKNKKNKFKAGMILAACLLMLGATLLYTKQFGHQSPAYAQTADKLSLPQDSASTANKNASASSSPAKPGTSTTPTTAAIAAKPKTVAKPTTTAPSTTLSPAPAMPRSAILYANPYSDVATSASAWASSNPTDSAAMNRLASTPMADWLGDFSGNVQVAANDYVSNAAAVGQIPVMVAYNIPERDCGSYSSGGASSPGAYEAWINQLAAGIGQRQSIVIVEPDALAGMECLTASDQQSRLQLVAYAVHTLRTQTKAAIYIDAGNATWQSTATMASRLNSADIAEATGFSLNVSNFDTTASSASYGASLSSQLGGKHFVIDTSRNGNGPVGGSSAWCNPDGAGFGNSPTLQTNNAVTDAYLWIKNPGESDGNCGADQSNTSAPAAGAWWPQYAIMLADHSGW